MRGVWESMATGKGIQARLGCAAAGLILIAITGSNALAEMRALANDRREEFGPNVLIFDPSMPSRTIQAEIDKVDAKQEHSEFGKERYALLFKPGEYHVNVPVGFYTEVIGLGATPDAVHIVGNVHADASLPRNNATCTF